MYKNLLTKTTFTTGSEVYKIKRSSMFTKFTQLSRSFNMRRTLIPQMRSLVNETEL